MIAEGSITAQARTSYSQTGQQIPAFAGMTNKTPPKETRP
jgi:hypothetical protein